MRLSPLRRAPSRRAVALSAAAAVLPLLPALAVGAPATAAAPPAPAVGFTDSMGGRAVAVRGTDIDKATTVAPRAAAKAAKVTFTQTREGARSSVVGLSKINVNFSGGDIAQQAAFNRAAQTWANLIQSPTEIDIDVTLAAQADPSVLGSAGPTRLFARETTLGPVLANTFYPAALANALTGVDQNGAEAEIAAEFNSSSTVFSSNPGTPPAGRYDFETVALHEIGHGLGFLGNMSVFVKNGRLVGGWEVDALTDRTPFIFDRRVGRINPAPVRTLFSLGQDSPALAQALTTGDVAFGGPNLTELRPCAPLLPRLYTPSTFSEGTSYSHLDEASYGPGSANSLMTPFINAQEVVHDPGPVVLAMLRDLGWKTQRRAFSSTLQQCAPAVVNAGTKAVTLKGTAPAGSDVTVYFRKRTEQDFLPRLGTKANAVGFWAVTFVPVDDWAYAATANGKATGVSATYVRATVIGPVLRNLKRNSTVTIVGKGTPGTVVQLRFRVASTPGPGYPILRNVVVSAGGNWGFPLKLTQTAQFIAYGVNGLRSPTYLYRAV